MHKKEAVKEKRDKNRRLSSTAFLYFLKSKKQEWIGSIGHIAIKFNLYIKSNAYEFSILLILFFAWDEKLRSQQMNSCVLALKEKRK